MSLSLGIIGCGGHAQHHAKHLPSDVILHGVTDLKLEAMKLIGGQPYKSALELVRSREIEAVLICTPDEFHLKQIWMALRNGKHVFCEKPLLVPGQEMEELENLFCFAEKNRLVLTSCHPRRLDVPIMFLKNNLMRAKYNVMGQFEEAIGFDFDFSYHKPSSGWKGEGKRSLLLDHINHEVDLMNHLFGLSGFEAWKISDGFDRYEVAGRRDDGIAFHFRGSRRLETEVYPEWCKVRFEKGEITLDMMAKVAHTLNHENLKTFEPVPDLGIDYDGRLYRVMENFYQSTMGQPRYLTETEMLMNTEAGIVLQNDGLQRVDIRS